ncbi:MAG: MFS transporter [Gammaproteobacteria bacterium]
MSSKTTLLAGLFGNALEWYDFILYANFAAIIANLFFPTKDPMTSLLLAFAVFATGFLVRPLGATLFGYIGDHRGRKAALITSMIVITIPTLLIGFLPTYASIGLAAPILLTLLRLLQGLAVSGELNTATTFLVEHAPDNRRGFAGSLVMSTAFLGILTGAITTTLVSALLTAQALHDWGWRIPFYLGGVIGVIGLFLRLRTKESPRFVQEKKYMSFKRIFSNYRKELLLTILLTSIMGVGNYIFIAYAVTFLDKIQGFSLREANTINLISILLLVLLMPIMGILSDHFGRKPLFKIGLFGFIVFSFPAFWLLSQKQFGYALAGDLLLGIILAPIAALIPILLAELFPTAVRNTGTALGYNICLAIFGGTTPLLALELVQRTGSNLAPAGYLILCAVLSLTALKFIEESYHKPLREIVDF